MKWINFLILFFILSCTSGTKKQNENVVVVKTDTLEIIRGFIYGLWSMDSGNALNNTGYYFKPDGSVDFVAADATGNWELKSKDSLRIAYSTINGELSSQMKIDSLDVSRMILSDNDGKYLFRKVPFGINADGVVLEGFAGKLYAGKEKKYTIDLPATKKIKLKLSSDNPEIVFRVFDGKNEITSTPLREWTSIIIRSGKYDVLINSPTSKSREAEEFDFKIIGY